MAASRFRRRALLGAAVVAIATAAWFLRTEASEWMAPWLRDSQERGPAAPLEAAPLAADLDTRARLTGWRATALDAAQDDDLVSLLVSLVAEGMDRGETLVEAGADEGSLRPCGLLGFGEAKEVTVRESVRVWRVSPFGRCSAYYDDVIQRHVPASGPLTVRLARGPVSLQARVVDDSGRPMPDIALEVVGFSPRTTGVLLGQTDRDGSARWDGLVGSTPALASLTVCARLAEESLDPGIEEAVVWNADRSQGTVTIRIGASSVVAGRLVGPGVGRILALVLRNPDTSVGFRHGPWRVPVSATGEFSIPKPGWLHLVRVTAEAKWAPKPSDIVIEAFVVPRVLALDGRPLVEVQTVLGARVVEGLLRDADGLPVRGAMVAAHARPSNREARAPTHAEWFEESVDVLAETNDEGRFQTRAGLPGIWGFTVVRGDGTRIQLPDVVEVPGPAPTTVVLTLP